MTAEADDRLAEALARLSAGPEQSPQLWKQALHSADRHNPPGRRLRHLAKKRLSNAALLGLAAGLLVVLFVVVSTPHLSRARDLARRSGEPAAPSFATPADSAPLPDALGLTDQNVSPALGTGGARQGPAEEVQADGGAPVRIALSRQIIRNARVELVCEDVPAAFKSVAALVDLQRGEYLEHSTIDDSGSGRRAELTLRVAAERLDEVLAALRKLGRVQREDVQAEDVTAQVVDLEARLRNERRIEAELLDLLEQREAAPLTEILQLRAALEDVRGRIERVEAQRQQLGRQVALATVRVELRTRPRPDSAAGRFRRELSDGLSSAWRDGLVGLARTVGAVVHIAIAGAIWWALLAVGLVVWWRRRRQRLTD